MKTHKFTKEEEKSRLDEALGDATNIISQYRRKFNKISPCYFGWKNYSDEGLGIITPIERCIRILESYQKEKFVHGLYEDISKIYKEVFVTDPRPKVPVTLKDL
ncbi:MAG: hypothetical protein ACLFPQ_06545 [Candidatus Woesearchaeota archaeon]